MGETTRAPGSSVTGRAPASLAEGYGPAPPGDGRRMDSSRPLPREGRSGEAPRLLRVAKRVPDLVGAAPRPLRGSPPADQPIAPVAIRRSRAGRSRAKARARW